jgi:hypothetical protein
MNARGSCVDTSTHTRAPCTSQSCCDASMQRVRRHPAYNEETLWADLMLLELASPVTSAKPVALASSTGQMPAQLTVMGWGLNEDQQIAPKLQ